jgi:hypothetical protein
VQRGIERRGVAARPCGTSRAEHAVVHRGNRVLAVGEGLVKRAVRQGAVALHPARLEQLAVLAVGERHLLAALERNRGELLVGGRERPVGVGRNGVEAPRVRQQALPRLVEHVLLFVEQALHEEAIDGQRRVGGHPGLNRGQRNREQLGVEPGARLLLPREQDLHLLAAPVDGVVPQVFVVSAGRRVHTR